MPPTRPHRPRARLVPLLIALSCMGAVRSSAADEAQEEARRLFLAGRQAYQAGRLAIAASSFEAAYKLAPLPALLFNLAQVHRKQFAVDGDPALLGLAIDEYKRYLHDAGVFDAPNRDASIQALIELQAIAARLAPAAPANAPAPRVQPTQVMVLTEAENATVRLDGGAPGPAPLLAEVAPGAHAAVVEAPGYFPAEVRLVAVAGRLVTGEAHLAARPGSLAVRSSDGARVWVDAREVGRLPLAPLSLAPGEHTIAVGARGRQLFSERIAIERGGRQAIEAPLQPTPQRRAVRYLLGSAVATALLAVAAGGVWAWEDHAASGIEQQRLGGQITPAQLADYDTARSRRDAWSTATWVTGGVAAALLAVTGAVYWFDMPGVNRADDGR